MTVGLAKNKSPMFVGNRNVIAKKSRKRALGLVIFQGEKKIMTGTATKHAAAQEAEKHSEGIVARTIEEQTAKLPSDIFLWGALGSIGVSLYFELKGNPEKSRFVGQWVSPFLLLGVYNKLVKFAGSDRVKE
jgi:hypothetical protein